MNKSGMIRFVVTGAAATLMLAGCVTTGPRPGPQPGPPEPEPPRLQYKTLRSADNHQCLDVVGDATKRGATVRMRRCDGSKSQRWAREGRRIIHAYGLCLDAARSTMHKNGGGVILWTCHDNSNQAWAYQRNTQLRNGGGKCLDVDKPAISFKKSNGKVHLWTCHGRNNQQWYFR